MKSVSELFGDRNDVAITAATAVAVSLGLSLLLHSTKKNKAIEARRVPPMPKSTLPILKSLLDIGGTVDTFHDWLYEQSAEFDNRPWMYHIPGRPETIVLSSPDTIEDAMSTQGHIFLRGPVGQYTSYDIFGKGMIIADGDQWYYHRKTASHLFSMQMMKEAMESTVHEKLEVFLDVLDIYHKRGKPFSLKEELLHFTMDVISKIGFGVELNTLKDSPDRDTDHEFLEAFDSAGVGFAVLVGEDALKFKPERMINPETGKLRVFSPFKFSAFGSGQHVCIGQRFAMMQLKMTLAALFSKFDIKTVEDPWDITYEFSIGIPVKGPLEVEVTPLASTSV
ncbi:hypothetical protein AM588_10000087 [Phytophthora nicotianae]|uniref:Cytochrome P450 86A2 n=1 Tax=Phytophthora nicotianae TaxID=4792 RepID=A0A0W8C4D1_PHYNI|nr:hypothetical protein AM588_10000087 [Phytophthora nicotianae]